MPIFITIACIYIRSGKSMRWSVVWPSLGTYLAICIVESYSFLLLRALRRLTELIWIQSYFKKSLYLNTNNIWAQLKRMQYLKFLILINTYSTVRELNLYLWEIEAQGYNSSIKFVQFPGWLLNLDFMETFHSIYIGTNKIIWKDVFLTFS